MTVTLVDRELADIISEGVLRSPRSLDEFIQPASIDIPVGRTAYHINHKFLPFHNNVRNLLEKETLQEFDLSEGKVLVKGQSYLIHSLDVDLPNDLIGRISPKSSIGRVDLMVRSILDNSGLYDTILGGMKGGLWLEVTPQSFNVRLEEGTPLSQLRLFRKGTEGSSFTQNFLYDSKGELIKPIMLDDNKIVVTLSIADSGFMGYEAVQTNEIIDLNRRDHDKNSFFKAIESHNGCYTLEQGKFYILYTKERIGIPPDYSLEMIPFSHLVGELRVHYAGFFDPGFGYPNPASGVLEVRPHETIRVFDGQPICMMEIFENSSVPTALYGSANNNYQGQIGPRLSKHFK